MRVRFFPYDFRAGVVGTDTVSKHKPADTETDGLQAARARKRRPEDVHATGAIAEAVEGLEAAAPDSRRRCFAIEWRFLVINTDINVDKTSNRPGRYPEQYGYRSRRL